MSTKASKKRKEDKWAKWYHRLIQVIGVCGVVNELFIQPKPDPYRILFIGSLIALPPALGADAKRRLQEWSREVRDE